MRRVLTILALGAVAALASCASSEPKVAQAEDKQRVLCDQERPTGSHIAVTRCRTQEQIEREREAASRTLDAPGKGAGSGELKRGG
jgi:hypothetical protein